MSRLWTRRQCIQTTALAAASLAIARSLPAADLVAGARPRVLELHNTHTGESLALEYRRAGVLDPSAIASFRNLLRDHRNGEVHDMDPGLYDQLFDLAAAARCDARFEVISGYRSPESNNRMSSEPGSGVARHSLHMEGRAIDVRLKACSCTSLRDLALAAGRGGVGYYRRSDFVHIDTGRFRTWAG